MIGDGLLAALESRQCSHQGILQAGASNGTNERGMAIDIELAATTTVPLVVRPRPGNAAGRIYRDVPFQRSAASVGPVHTRPFEVGQFALLERDLRRVDES